MNEYGLGRISGSYTSYSLPNGKGAAAKAQRYADNAVACGFENINKLLIHFARAKQLGIVPFNHEQYTELVGKLNSVIQVYYLLMLLGKHVHPDFESYNKNKQALRDEVTDSENMRLEFQPRLEALEKMGIKLDVSFENFLNGQKDLTDVILYSIYTHLTFEKLVAKIIELKIDVKSIYENPTEENLERALAIFEFPKTSTVKTGVAFEEQKEVTLSKTQFFTLNKDYPTSSQNIWSVDRLYRCSKNHKGDGMINPHRLDSFKLEC